MWHPRQSRREAAPMSSAPVDSDPTPTGRRGSSPPSRAQRSRWPRRSGAAGPPRRPDPLAPHRLDHGSRQHRGEVVTGLRLLETLLRETERHPLRAVGAHVVAHAVAQLHTERQLRFLVVEDQARDDFDDPIDWMRAADGGLSGFRFECRGQKSANWGCLSNRWPSQKPRFPEGPYRRVGFLCECSGQ